MRRKIPWWVGGILLTLLLLFTFSVFGADRPLGASTFAPYLSYILFGLDPHHYTYIQIVEKPGAWEGVMLIGAFAGAFFTSVFITKSFRFSLMPTLWKERKNSSIRSRLFWSFIAGFMMILGARMAGGCTSGHLLSGGSQLALSSLLFGGIVMSSAIITGRFFYTRKEKCDV